MKPALPLATFVVALLTAGCLAGAAAPLAADTGPLPVSGVETLSLRATEYSFGVERLEARAGRVQFRIENAGTQHHELVLVPIDGSRLGMPIARSEPLLPGETRYVRAGLRPGKYLVVCTQVSRVDGGASSHMPLGMSAALEVVS